MTLLPRIALTTSLILLLLFETSAHSQTFRWDNPVDGSWSDTSMWDPIGTPNTSTHNVVFDAAGGNANQIYVIDYSGLNLSINQILWTDPGAILNIQTTNSSDASLSLGSDMTVHGTLRLLSDFDGRDVSLTRAGMIAIGATGSLEIGGFSTASNTFRNLRADTFINNGSVNVFQNARLNQGNGVYTNNNSFQVNSAVSLTFGVNNTFNQDAGTFDNQGTFRFDGDILNFNAGNFTGNAIELNNSTFNNSSTGTGTFNLTGGNSYSGNVDTGQFLNLDATSTANTSATVVADFTNFSTINLTSDFDGRDVALIRAGSFTNATNGVINFNGTSTAATTDRNLQIDSFVNDGTVNIDQDTRFNRGNGTYTNNNNINVASGKSLTFGVNNTFNQDAGTFDNQGTFGFDNDTLNFNGGNFTGNDIQLNSSTLNNLATGTATFNMTGGNLYQGDLNVGQFLNLDATAAGSTSATAVADFTNFSTINLTSDFDARDVSLTRAGSFTNAAGAIINFNGTSTATTTDRNLQVDSFVNNGTINVDQNTRFNRGNGTYTNNNTINVATGKSLTFGVNNTFNQDAGTFDNQGALRFDGDTLNFNGGNFIGNAIELNGSTLNNLATGTATFNLTGGNFYQGDLNVGQFLNLDATSIANTSATVVTDFTNFSTINLTSDFDARDVTLTRAGSFTNAAGAIINFNGTSTATTTDRNLQIDSFVNNGTINIDQNTRFNRGNGTYTNNNTINVAAGKSLTFGVNNTFNQDAGTFDNQGTLRFDGDTLNFNGGNFTGNDIQLNSSTLNNLATGTATFNMTGGNMYQGDLNVGQFLNLDATSAGGTSATAVADFTNFSTINLTSDFEARDVTLTRAGSFTNAAGAIINFNGTSTATTTDRNLQVDSFVNNGTINVDQTARFNRGNGVYTNNSTINVATGKSLTFGVNNTFNQDAGTFDNQGTFRFDGDILNFNGGNFIGNAIGLNGSTLNNLATGTATFNMTGGNLYQGDLNVGQFLNLDATSAGGTSATAVADFTNFSTINLTSDFDARDVLLTRAGSITNAAGAIINFNGTSTATTTDRRINSELINAGLIDVQVDSVSTRIGSAGANHENTGTYLNRNSQSVVTFVGSSFVNEAGGVLSGIGEYDFSATGLTSNGTIDPGLSAGTLILDGDIQLATGSDLLIELGGLVQGTEHDFIDVLDTIELDGNLSIDFIDGFESAVTTSDSFTILSSSSLTGTFDGYLEGDLIATRDGLGWFTISYAGNNVTLSNFSSVPEPTGFAVSLLALSWLLIGRRKTRKA